jgi:hypothetical protein
MEVIVAKRATKMEYPVTVLGGGVAGAVSALACARNGVKVLLVERSDFLGGVAVSGLGLLGFKDRAGHTIIGGIAKELVEELRRQNATLGENYCPILTSLTPIDPNVMRLIIMNKCSEAGIEILLHTEVINAEIEDGRVKAAILHGKGHFYKVQSQVFIDATGDGDFAYLCGAHYQLGNGEGEIQAGSMIFSMVGVNLDETLAYLEIHPEEATTPEGYEVSSSVDFYKNAHGYNLLGFGGVIKKAAVDGAYHVPRDRFSMITQPNCGIVTINNTRAMNFNGSNPISLTEGTLKCYQQIEELVRFIPKYIPGYQNSSISMIAPQMGVRDSRRFRGLTTLCYEDVKQGVIPPDTVALGGYNVDIHHGSDEEGDLQIITSAYGIPYGCLVSSDFDNLMYSGRIISVDWITFSSSRVMATIAAIGEACGTAAAQAISTGVAPSCLPVDILRCTLLKNGAILNI